MVVAGGGGDLHDRLTDANLSLDRSEVRGSTIHFFIDFILAIEDVKHQWNLKFSLCII